MYVMTAVHWLVPGFHSFPAFDSDGLWKMLLLHMGPTEFIYYWFHRALHSHALFAKYHSHHHKSFVTEPVSGTCHPFLETVGYTANFAVPMLGTWLCGAAPLAAVHTGGCSLATFYLYTSVFDVLNMVGHCNWEFVPCALFDWVPGLKYLIYSPAYHSLHHSRVHTNFCLFMPIYDLMFGTLERERENPSLWTSIKLQAASRRRVAPDVPSCVFLAHGTDLLSAAHLPFWFRGFASQPYSYHWSLLPLWPLCAAACAVLWLFGSVFVSHVEKVGGKPVQTWVAPRFGFQYFLGRKEEARINNLIASAIKAADSAGVQVFGLGALNKAEHLNGGGAIFPPLLDAQLPEGLKTRVVHGNTLTAACLLAELPPGCSEVFLTGATSKLGRAAALYLCRKGVTVRMLTEAKDRFETIQNEAAPEHRSFLVHATSYEEGRKCATWVVCKPCGPKAQACAPPGTHFHQVVVPPIEKLRADCRYGELAAMDLPPSATDTRACELFMPRRRVFACHAGALTHMLQGWDYHEVGAINIDRIDSTFEASLSLGFKPATDGWPESAAKAAAAAMAWSETVAAAAKKAAAEGATATSEDGRISPIRKEKSVPLPVAAQLTKSLPIVSETPVESRATHNSTSATKAAASAAVAAGANSSSGSHHPSHQRSSSAKKRHPSPGVEAATANNPKHVKA